MTAPVSSNPPVVMCLSGSDPSGGAGIQADIEAVLSQGCHPAPVITAVTAQDTRNVADFEAVRSPMLVEQARAVLEDMPVAAFKIGMIGSRGNVEAVHTLARDYPDIPLILDPVLVAAGGGPLSDEAVREAILDLLVPEAVLMTPNGPEARTLIPEAETLAACADALMAAGADYVLITGGDEPTEDIVNTLFGGMRELDRRHYTRLPGAYHGSGCTLAATSAALIAQGLDPLAATRRAQDYTHESLRHARRLGMGQLIPNRLYWATTGAHLTP